MFSRAYDYAASCSNNARGWLSSAKDKWDNYGPPSVFSVGRVVSTLGSAKFNADKLADTMWKYFDKTNSPTPLWFKISVRSLSMSSNFVIQTVTRVPANFMTYWAKKKRIKIERQPLGEPENLFIDDYYLQGSSENKCAGIIYPKLGIPGNAIYLATAASIFISLFFLFINSEFSAITLYEFIMEMAGASVNTLYHVCEFAFSLFIALCNAYSNFSYNFDDSISNVIHYYKLVRAGKAEFNHRVAITTIIALLSISATMLLSYYSTMNAFIKLYELLPFLASIMPPEATQIMILLSTVVGGINDAATKTYQLHRNISEKIDSVASYFKDGHFNQTAQPVNANSDNLPLMWKITKQITHGAGILDTLFGALSYTIAIPIALGKIFKIDASNAAPMIYTVTATTASAAMNYAFGVRRGIERTEEMIKNNVNQDAKDDGYHQPPEDDLEAGNDVDAVAAPKPPEPSVSVNNSSDRGENEESFKLSNSKFSMFQQKREDVSDGIEIQRLKDIILDNDSDSEKSFSL
jgi:hypothetical protein